MEIQNQIKQIQELRKQTQECLQSSASVVQTYNLAEETYREHIEAKKYSHLGNENFVSRLYPKKTYSMGFQFKKRPSQPSTPNKRESISRRPAINLKKVEVISEGINEMTNSSE